MDVVRKSVTITKENVQYVEQLVQNKHEKNFSRAVNNSITARRRQEDEQSNNVNRR